MTMKLKLRILALRRY